VTPVKDSCTRQGAGASSTLTCFIISSPCASRSRLCMPTTTQPTNSCLWLPVDSTTSMPCSSYSQPTSSSSCLPLTSTSRPNVRPAASQISLRLRQNRKKYVFVTFSFGAVRCLNLTERLSGLLKVLFQHLPTVYSQITLEKLAS